MNIAQPEKFQFSLPTRVHLESGGASRIGELCESEGYSSAFLVIDPQLSELGIADGMIRSLEKSGIKFRICTNLKPNPIDTDMEDAWSDFDKHQESLVIGFGGGSALDTAKGVALLATNGGRLRDYAGNGRVPKRAWPLVLVPTTAGTGSEVSASISVTTHDTHDKLAIRDFNNCAWIALLDPALLAGLPASVAAVSGADALTHAVESYVSNRSTTMSRLFAFEAARRIACSLEAFVADRTDEYHATNMLYGSCLAAVAFSQTGTGNAHALSRALGGQFDIPHGLGCGVALEHVMRFNRDAALQGFADLADAFDIKAATPAQRADLLINRVAQIRANIGLPADLDIALDDQTLDLLANWTVENSTPNPRKTSKEDAKSLLLTLAPQKVLNP